MCSGTSVKWSSITSRLPWYESCLCHALYSPQECFLNTEVTGYVGVSQTYCRPASSTLPGMCLAQHVKWQGEACGTTQKPTVHGTAYNHALNIAYSHPWIYNAVQVSSSCKLFTMVLCAVLTALWRWKLTGTLSENSLKNRVGHLDWDNISATLLQGRGVQGLH